MKVTYGNVPLSCNYAAISHMLEWKKKALGETKEAIAYRMQEHQKLASIYKSGGDVTEAFRKYCGNIINMDIDLMIYAESILSSMFEIVPVTGNDIPAYTTWVTPDVNVNRMSAHGVPPSNIKFMSGTQYFPTFYVVATDQIYQPRQSIITGETGVDQRINAMARNQMNLQIEDDMWTLLAASVGSMGSTTWVYDTRIQEIPTTNLFDFSSEGGLTKGLFQKILAAVDLVPSRTRPGESAKIRNMFIPHVAAQDIREWVSVVSTTSGQTASQDAADTVTPELQRQLENTGMISSLWGENLGIRRVNRLMGTSSANFGKYLWVFLDEPVGRLYVKTDEDRIDVLNDRIPYYYGYLISRVIAMEVPDPWKPNFMLIKFAS